MSARPKSKVMWALEHIQSGTWDHGHSNETLYWAEHEAALECRRRGAGGWRPVRVRVTVLADQAQEKP